MPNAASAKIRRLSACVRAVGLFLLVSVLFLYLATWLFPELPLWDQHWARIARVGALPVKAAASFEGAERFLIGAVCLPYLACLAIAYRHLDGLLRGFERAEFFEPGTVAHLRAFAGFLLAAKVLSLAANHVRAWLYMPLASPGTRPAFALTGDEVALLLMCALIFLIGHLMEEGNRLAEENRGFL